MTRVGRLRRTGVAGLVVALAACGGNATPDAVETTVPAATASTLGADDPLPEFACDPANSATGDDRFCIDAGYTGPMNVENLAPFIGLTIGEARALAAESGWVVWIMQRDDGLTSDDVEAAERFDRFGVRLVGGRIAQVRPG